jgi:peptide-methionine (S)-S-oxide reductase
MLFSRQKTAMVTPDAALPGRDSRPFSVPATHFVLSAPLEEPYPDGLEIAYFAAGCFWGVERIFWQVDGVVSTAVGYQGGITPNPTYDEVCSARTGHTEAVKVVFDPKLVTYADLLKVFWESHDPTQGMRQGNDTGTQYRSAIYTTSEEQQKAAEASREEYQPWLNKAGYGEITTEIEPAKEFFYAESYHQQYLAKNPAGYCGIGGTGVSCPIGTGAEATSPADAT